MTQAALSPILAATSTAELLASLKDLKNSVIGNTWKKVEVAEDEVLLRFLLSLLASKEQGDSKRDIIIETAVIIGALANGTYSANAAFAELTAVGPLTIRPLLQAGAPAQLLRLIKSLSQPPSSAPSASTNRLLPPLVRALRNVLVTTADLVWGHLWGVGAEKKVVSTGLFGDEAPAGESSGKGKAVAGKTRSWRPEGLHSLGLCFEQGNLSCIMNLIYRHHDPQIVLPLYQLLSRLIALPSHREALTRWQPPMSHVSPSSTLHNVRPDPASYTPYILTHLLTTTSIACTAPAGRKVNAKLLEASLDLLAAVIKGQPNLAAVVRRWNIDDDVFFDAENQESSFVDSLVEMLTAGPTPVRIAAANCVTNIIKADKGHQTPERIKSAVLSMRLLDEVAALLASEGLEERVKLCFVLAALVSDHGDLQKCAHDKRISHQLVKIVQDLDDEDIVGEIGMDLASRSKEAALLGLASLSFLCEPARMYLSETSPPFLPHLLKALSHPSYGVRAASCQLTRALSRTISVLRTSLMDSGVGAEVVETLRREVEAHARRERGVSSADSEDDDLGERAYTVEVAATATLCNLITDFSPLRTMLLRGGGIELLCDLTRSPYEPLALNSLWALKNLTFRGDDSLKSSVMSVLGWATLRRMIMPSTPISLRIQALQIAQNLTADALASEVNRYLELLGEGEFVDVLCGAAREGQDPEIRIPALYVISNLALGNERTRNVIIGRLDVIELLSKALNAKQDMVKIPAIRCLRHLIESNAKTHRPRQAMLDLLHPYQLKPRLKDLAETSPSLDVCHGAVGLLDVLERGRESGSAAPVVGSAPR